MDYLSRKEEHVLLTIWKLQNNAYGVTIRELVSKLTGTDWSFGAVYVPLDKLTRKGFVNKMLSGPTAQRGGRSKCLYTLSKEGKQALKEIRAVQDALWDGIPTVAFD